MSNKKDKSTESNATEKAKAAAENAKQAAAGFFQKTATALKSPTAKEVYKGAFFVAAGATITALTGWKIPMGK